MKLQAIMNRAAAKQGTDLQDIARLILDEQVRPIALAQLGNCDTSTAADIALHVDLWLVDRRREALRWIHDAGGTTSPLMISNSWPNSCSPRVREVSSPDSPSPRQVGRLQSELLRLGCLQPLLVIGVSAYHPARSCDACQVGAGCVGHPPRVGEAQADVARCALGER